MGREAEECVTVRDLDNANFSESMIAYPSECSTAEISLGDMADESINLTNNFQLAGFQHVIGTLWGADDDHDDAVALIASFFYLAMVKYKDKKNAPACLALHGAIMQYRNVEDNAVQVSKWAPFIHLGC